MQSAPHPPWAPCLTHWTYKFKRVEFLFLTLPRSTCKHVQCSCIFYTEIKRISKMYIPRNRSIFENNVSIWFWSVCFCGVYDRHELFGRLDATKDRRSQTYRKYKNWKGESSLFVPVFCGFPFNWNRPGGMVIMANRKKENT